MGFLIYKIYRLIYESTVKIYRNRKKTELVTFAIWCVYTSQLFSHNIIDAVSRSPSRKRNKLKLPRPRGADQPCDAITYNPYHPRRIPLSTAAFPTAKTPEEACDGDAYPRSDTALSVPADTGKMSPGEEKRGSQPQGGGRGTEGPGRTCRSRSSKGRIIRADRIVLLVIQIRLSYPALRRPGISRQLRRRGESVIFLQEIPQTLRSTLLVVLQERPRPSEGEREIER